MYKKLPSKQGVEPGSTGRLPAWYLVAIRIIYAPVIGSVVGGVAAGLATVALLAASLFDLARCGESLAALFFLFLLGAGWGVLTGAVGGLFAIPLLFFCVAAVFTMPWRSVQSPASSQHFFFSGCKTIPTGSSPRR